MRTVILCALNLRRAIVDWFAERRERAERKRHFAEFNQFCLKEAQRHERLRLRRLERQRQRELGVSEDGDGNTAVDGKAE